jgi:hypothetical protein
MNCIGVSRRFKVTIADRTPTMLTLDDLHRPMLSQCRVIGGGRE